MQQTVKIERMRRSARRKAHLADPNSGGIGTWNRPSKKHESKKKTLNRRDRRRFKQQQQEW
jgi:hypothetical protein